MKVKTETAEEKKKRLKKNRLRKLLGHVSKIRIVYQQVNGPGTPFVQTFFEGTLDQKGQRMLKSPKPINPKTKELYRAMDLYNLHVRQILLVLGDAELDGGGFHERKGASEWSACFKVADRKPRYVG
ncbi:MAG: hypothetical protein HY918_01335 [Candidatus Doudnabacteria bacterium]|nr:hypothetical protein [Candidatus Doudnabacteria bacterium]